MLILYFLRWSFVLFRSKRICMWHVVEFEVVLASDEVFMQMRRKNPICDLRWETVPTNLESSIDLADLNKATDFDEYATLMLIFSYVSSLEYVVSRNLEYSKSLHNLMILQSFTFIQLRFFNIMRISNQIEFITEFVQIQLEGRR
jgi:hypothetical protein